MKPTTPRTPGRVTRVGFAIAGILATTTIGLLFSVNNVLDQSRSQLEASQLQHVQQQAATLEALLQGSTLRLQELTSTLPPNQTDLPQLLQRIRSWQPKGNEPLLKALFLIDPEGNIQEAHPTAALQQLAIPYHRLNPGHRRLANQQSCQLISEGERTLAELFVPVGRHGQWQGTLCALLDLSEFIATQLPPSSAGGKFLALLNEQDLVLLDPSGRPGGSFLTAPGGADEQLFELRQAVARGQSYNRVLAIDPEAMLVSIAPVHLLGQVWSIAYGLPLTRLTPGPATHLALTLPLILLWLGGGWAWRQLCRQQSRIGELDAELATSRQTERQLGEQLVTARGYHEQFLQHTSTATFLINPENGSLLEINRRAEESLGYTCGEIRQLSLKALFPGPQRRRFLKLIQRVRKEGQVDDPELQFRRKDGSLFIGAVQVRSGWLDRRPVIFGSFRDVTPSIRQTVELRRQNRQLSLLNEIAHQVAEDHDLPSMLGTILTMVVKSLKVSGGGIFLLKNRGTEMQLVIHRGIPPEVLHDLNQIKPGEGLAGKVITTGRPRLSTDLQKDYRRASTSVVADGWHAFLAVPLIAGETPVGVLFIFDRGTRVLNREDIRLMQAIGRQVGPLVKSAELFDELQWQHRLNQASLRELERSRGSLRQHLDQLEQHHRLLQGIDQMKSSFLALASHELRTPLTHVLSGVEFLQDTLATPPDSDTARALHAISHGGLRLKVIINDLLEAARLESSSLYLAREKIDARDLLEGLLSDHQQPCSERALDCSMGICPDGVTLNGDLHHLRRALTRLLENAVKFTPEGGWVRVEGALRSAAEIEAIAPRLRPFSSRFFENPLTAEYLEIAIIDNGIGLDPEDQLRVFDKFVEVGDIASHSTSNERFGGKGVGLGLTLAKGVIEAHEGLLWVESEGPDQGSRFALLLPTAGVDEKPHD